jgi:hypothetical protein
MIKELIKCGCNLLVRVQGRNKQMSISDGPLVPLLLDAGYPRWQLTWLHNRATYLGAQDDN